VICAEVTKSEQNIFRVGEKLVMKHDPRTSLTFSALSMIQ